MKIISLPNLADNCLLYLKAEYVALYRQKGIKKAYNEFDYLRIGYIISTYFRGQSCNVLDVGTGPGVLLNWMNLQPNITAVGIDNKEYSTYYDFSGASNRIIMNAAKMNFSDNSFDLVFCLEVLEHLNDRTMLDVIREMKRVSRGKVIISVPFEEPEPRPKYHIQRFTENKIKELVASANLSLLCKEGQHYPIALIDIDCQSE